MKYIQKIKSFSKKTLLLILGIIAGATFSVYAAGTWHGTDWIQTGEVISAQKIKDNFDYLYENGGEGGGGGGSATFVSSEQTLNHDGNYISVEHGLGQEPVIVQISILNKVADRGYSPGDTVILNPPVGTNTYQHWGASISVDDVNINVLDRKTIYLPTKTDGKPAQIKYNNWKMIIKAVGEGGESSGGGWSKIEEVDLVDSTSYVFTGLDGDSQENYKIMFQGTLDVNGTTINKRILLRPNSISTNGDYLSLGAFSSTKHTGWQSGTDDSKTGFLIGRAGYDRNAAVSFEYSISALTGKKRVGYGDSAFVMEDDYLMIYETLIGDWKDTTTNITSLEVLAENGGKISGKLTLYSLK